MARFARKQPGDVAPPEGPASGAVLPALPPEPRPSAALAPAEPSPELLAHLLSKRVFERLKRYVRKKGMAEREIEDMAQQSLAEAWNGRHTWGPTTEDLDRLLFRITNCNVVDEKKRFARSLGGKKKKNADEPRDEDALRAEREARAAEAARDPRTEAETEYQGSAGDRDDDCEVPPVDVPSSVHPWLRTAPDDHEARDRLRRVDAYVEKHPGFLRAAGWLMRNYAGHSFREIAETDGTTENAVCVAVSKLRAELREAAKQGLLAIFVALFLGILVKRLHHRPQDDYGIPAPKPAPTVVAPSPQPAPPQAKAEELRRSAREACQVGMFQECLDDLDAAARLDPAGDEDPSVKALHVSARQAVKHPK